MTGIVSLSSPYIRSKCSFLENIISSIPLNDLGFAWLIPSIIGFIAGGIIGSMNKQTTAKSENAI